MVVPSRVGEPFGNTAVEAALAGRPLIVSESSGLVEATHGLPGVHRVKPGDAFGDRGCGARDHCTPAGPAGAG